MLWLLNNLITTVNTFMSAYGILTSQRKPYLAGLLRFRILRNSAKKLSPPVYPATTVCVIQYIENDQKNPPPDAGRGQREEQVLGSNLCDHKLRLHGCCINPYFHDRH